MSLPSMANTSGYALSPGPQSLAPSFNDVANLSSSSNISNSVANINNRGGGGGAGTAAAAGRGRLARGGRAYVKPSNMQFVSSPVSMPDAFSAPGGNSNVMATPQFFVPSPAAVDPSAPSDFVTSPAPQSSDYETGGGGELSMYSANLAPPAADANSARRGGLAARGRYPR